MISDFERAIDELTMTDVDLASVIDQWGRPTRFSRPPTFQTLVLLILEQQVSLDSARAAYDRLSAVNPGVEPVGLLELSDETLRTCGFSRQKSRYVRALSERVVTGLLDIYGLTGLSDDEVRATLTEIPGIGPWTADVFLMSSLGRLDI